MFDVLSETMLEDEPLLNIEEGERIIADFDPATDRDRGVVSLEAQESTSRINPSTGVEETTTGTDLGLLRQPNNTDSYEITRFETTVASVRDFTTTDRNDLDPIGIGRDRGSGEFTPDNTVPAPKSPSDRDPDDGEFTTPDPRPITDIGRQISDGLFDLF